MANTTSAQSARGTGAAPRTVESDRSAEPGFGAEGAARRPGAPNANQSVRAVRGAREERPPVRWAAIVAGLVLALGTQLVLGLLGAAVALSSLRPADIERLGAGFGIWIGIASLLGFFVGGWAAAALGPSVRRGEGALAGALTWATSAVVAIWLVGGAGAGSALTGALATGQLVQGRAGAWLAFAGAALSLFAAIAGGLAGVARKREGAAGVEAIEATAPASAPSEVSSPQAPDDDRADRKDEVRRQREAAREDMHREQTRGEDERGAS